MSIENFKEEEILYLTDNIYNFNSSLNISLDSFNNGLNYYKYNKKILINSNKYDKLSLLIDPYINYFYLNNTNKSNYDIYPKEGIFLYITNKILTSSECVWDIANKTILYMYPSDYYFIQAFIKGYRVDINTVKIIRISYYDFITNNIPKFDVIITYVIPGSNYMSLIEKSRYYINGFNDIDIDRIKMFYPFLKETKGTVSSMFNTTIVSGYLSNVKTIIPTMNYVIIKNIPIIYKLPDNLGIKENFITRLDMPIDYIGVKKYDNINTSNIKEIEALYNDREYGCYGNENVKNKFECDSMYNIDGSPKNFYSLWDKKCYNDTECPFYNPTYSSGGCLKGGYCELPIGIKRTGFMKYNDEELNAPFCYNCENTTDINCCKNNRSLEYAFSNDFDKRVKKGVKPIVAPLKYII
jgi:hypothetical protein